MCRPNQAASLWRSLRPALEKVTAPGTEPVPPQVLVGAQTLILPSYLEQAATSVSFVDSVCLAGLGSRPEGILG